MKKVVAILFFVYTRPMFNSDEGKVKMKLGLTKEGYAEYVWTTPDRYEITQSQVEDIRDIVKEATGTTMSHKDILRMVDLFKSFSNDDFKV